MMRTIVIRVDARAAGGQHLGHPAVHILDDGRGEKPAGNARLVAYEHDGETRAVEDANRVDGPREKLDALGTIEVPDFFDDGAVAVEKDGALERVRHSIFRVAASASAAGMPIMHV